MGHADGLMATDARLSSENQRCEANGLRQLLKGAFHRGAHDYSLPTVTSNARTSRRQTRTREGPWGLSRRSTSPWYLRDLDPPCGSLVRI